MKVLGISGSPIPNGTTARMVKTVLAGCSVDTEFITLAGMDIMPCKSCLQCKDTNKCIVADDFSAIRPKLLDANALVIGAPNYHNMVNGLTHCFLERFFQFRHRGKNLLAGKLGVAIGVGGRQADQVIEKILFFFRAYEIESIGSVFAQGVHTCFNCGYGNWCPSGAIVKLWGPNQDLEHLRPKLDEQQDKLKIAYDLGKLISERLKEKAPGHKIITVSLQRH